MIPNREGLFHAYAVNVGVGETGPNKLATATILFRLFEELQPGGEWADCSHENFDVTGYFYMERKDGGANSITVDALRAAFNWDGRDAFWLQDTDLSKHAVQVKLALEEYGGKTRLKVQYLNPYGATGGGTITKADEPTRKSIAARLGPKLRAMVGAAPAVAPKPAAPAAPARQAAPAAPVPTTPTAATTPTAPTASASSPKLPPAKSKPAPPVAAPPPLPAPEVLSPMEAAWAEFCSNCPSPKWEQATIEQEWFRVLAALFPGKQPDELSDVEWATMRDVGPSKIIPF